jgi:hypothetical protein
MALLLITKTCTKCEAEKDLDEFQRDNTRTDGYHPWCKDCRRQDRILRRDTGEEARWSREYRARIKAEALAHYGALCVCCGTTYEAHLTLDHVGGGGYQERQERAGTPTWRIAKQEGFPERFQVMCFNCNWAKHIDGECRCQEVS